MNGNMNLGKRVSALEKDGGADIKKEISDLQNAVTTVQNDINALETKVNSGHVYSTEEKVVGTWIDGKQVYEITIEFVAPFSAYNVKNLNINKIIEWNSFATDAVAQFPIPYPNPDGNSSQITCFYYNNSLEFKIGSSLNPSYIVSTIRYTKNN